MRSNSNSIVPWIVMGLSMGVGYFGLESFLAWRRTTTKSRSTPETPGKKKKKHPLEEQLMRHVQGMSNLLSWSNARAWLMRCWTFPVVLGGYHDVFWGIFVAVLPQTPVVEEEQRGASRVVARTSTEGDLFLSLPPQLNPRGMPPKIPAKGPKNERYLELLLHNISHTDLVLGIEVMHSTQSSSLKDSMCLGRPRFSAFDMYCRKLLKALTDADTSDNAEIVLVPQYQRAQNDPRYTIQPSGRPHVSTGFCWKERSSGNNPRVIPLTQALADLRVRGKDMASKIEPYLQPQRAASPDNSSWNMVESTGSPPTLSKEDALVELKAVFFPLLATLLPRWHAQIAQKYSQNQKSSSNPNIHKVLVLVTGVGTPRNWTHSITGNSTQVLADLMELFLCKVYPDITVVKIHSDTNIFRYDDSILFVQQELMPTVNAYRDAHATQAPYPHETQHSSVEHGLQPLKATAAFDVDWKKSFAVTLSFADGSPARTHAIQTALRIYRPAYYHIWQLKTFWHERKIVDDDVEVHSFEEMETSPALAGNEIQGDLAAVVNEMKAFREEMTETLLDKKSSDIHSFWLRKTHKPVLAVLLVQSANGPQKLYRGTNMEVSMPTGSLCAERNVIGTALASNPKLKREDLKCIAVLAVPQPPKSSGHPPRPPPSAPGDSEICGSCRTSRRNSWEEAQLSSNNNGNNNNATTTMTGRQMRRESFDEREEDWMLSYGNQKPQKPETVDSTALPQQQAEPSTPIRQISLFSSESSNSLVDMIKQFPDGSPPTQPRHAKERTVIVRSNNHDIDLNPLRPCGACHEWLKKIAECNPNFQIMTFTDADCNGVYVTPCQE